MRNAGQPERAPCRGVSSAFGIKSVFLMAGWALVKPDRVIKSENCVWRLEKSTRSGDPIQNRTKENRQIFGHVEKRKKDKEIRYLDFSIKETRYGYASCGETYAVPKLYLAAAPGAITRLARRRGSSAPLPAACCRVVVWSCDVVHIHTCLLS